MHTDLSHTEVSQDLPEPTEIVASPWILGTRALPVATLSVASLVALVVVSVVLLHNSVWRQLFELPFPAAWLAWPAMLTSLLILWSTSSRPGRSLPRYWAWALTAFCFALALLVSIRVEPQARPLLHALVVAAAAAVLTLTPRLIKLRPHSAYVQRIALLSLLGVLVLVIPSACFVGTAVEQHRREQVATQIRALRELTAEIRQITQAYNWQKFDSSPELAEAHLQRLSELSLEARIRDPELFRVAGILGSDDKLIAAASELIDIVGQGFEVERLPRISTLSEPAIRWDTFKRQWLESALLPQMTNIVGRYFSELGRLFRELDPGSAAFSSDALQQLAEHHRTVENTVRSALNQELSSFTDHWSVFRSGLLDPSGLSLADILKLPLLRDGERYLTASSLGPLLNLPQGRAREFVRTSPGCHSREYLDRGNFYFRIDCYAFLPRPSGAELRIEFRLVYLSGSELIRPLEAYFVFPIPADRKLDDFRDEAMNALKKAVDHVSPYQAMAFDRGTSVATGFYYNGGGSQFTACPIFTEYTANQGAIQVRIVSGLIRCR